MRNNKGFSLVELVVVVALLGVFGAAIIGFIFTGTNSYKTVSKDSELQYNAQLCINQLENLIIDASKGLAYFYVGGESEVESFVVDDASIPTNATQKTLAIYNANDRYYISWYGDSVNSIYLQKDEINSKTGALITAGTPQLMASNVDDFSCSIDEKNRIVKLSLGFYKTKISFTVDKNITLRNGLIVNGAISDMYEEANKPEVLDVRIYYKGNDVTGMSVTELLKVTKKSATKGEFVFTAKVFGKNSPSQDVIWKTNELSDSSSSIQNGRLVIGVNESNYNVTITATSKADSSKSASTGMVLRQITGISLTVNTASENYSTGDLVEFTSEVMGINLLDTDKAIGWSVTGATNTGKYSADNKTQEYKLTANAGSNVTVTTTSKSDSSFSKTIKIPIGDTYYELHIAWKDKASNELKRDTKTETIAATLTPDDNGKHPINWEYVLYDSDGEVNDKLSDGFSFTNSKGKETQLRAGKRFDWSFTGTIEVRAYITINEEKVYSAETITIAIKHVLVRLWVDDTSYDLGENDDITVDFFKGEAKTFYYEILSGYEGTLGVTDNDKNHLYGTSINNDDTFGGRKMSSVTITAYDRSGTGPLNIQIDNFDLFKININIK